MEHPRIKHLRRGPRQWQEIGSWDVHAYMHGFEFSGLVPDWLRVQIPELLGQVGEENLRKIKDRRKRQKLIIESKAFEGTKILKGRHYLYKITFQEGDQSNYGHIYRKPLP